MTNQIWIPKEKELVKWKGKLYTVISVNLGGKCNLKQFSTTSRITKKISEVDISELEKVY